MSIVQEQQDDSARARWHPRLRRFHDYWLSLHPQGGGLPGRQHLEPTQIPDCLPTLWLLEVHREPLRFRYRLVGTRIVELSGRELTGLWLDEAHPGAVALSDTLVTVAERAIPDWRRGKPRLFLAHKDFIEIERLMLPLAKDGRTVDMIVACTVPYRPDGSSL